MIITCVVNFYYILLVTNETQESEEIRSYKTTINNQSNTIENLEKKVAALELQLGVSSVSIYILHT